tara:strand:+ start:281 stop:586 length:306 start_codon:yes stop_codon:yes gene_type:complete
MWSNYVYERSACIEECCRRTDTHPNNYWVCKACLANDAAQELIKLLRFCEKDAKMKKSRKALTTQALKYRKQFIKMGGAIKPFTGTATQKCKKGCCWAFTP